MLLSKLILSPRTSEYEESLSDSSWTLLHLLSWQALTAATWHLVPRWRRMHVPTQRLSTPTLACALEFPLLCVCVNHYLRCLQHNGTSSEYGAFVIHGGGGGDGRWGGGGGGVTAAAKTQIWKRSSVGWEVGPTARDLTSKREWAAARRPPQTHAERPGPFQAIKGNGALIGDRTVSSSGGQAVNTPSPKTRSGQNKMGSRSEALVKVPSDTSRGQPVFRSFRCHWITSQSNDCWYICQYYSFFACLIEC